MGVVSTTFTLCTLGTFALAALAGRMTERAVEVYYAAAVVVIFAGFSRAVGVFLDPPWSMAFYPLQDVMCAALCFGAYRGSRNWWKAALGLGFVAQCGIHAWFWASGDDSVSTLRQYILANNVFYAAELAVLFVAGGGHVVGVLRDRWGVFHPRALARVPHSRGHR